jgi:hypothetical protein
MNLAVLERSLRKIPNDTYDFDCDNQKSLFIHINRLAICHNIIQFYVHQNPEKPMLNKNINEFSEYLNDVKPIIDQLLDNEFESLKKTTILTYEKIFNAFNPNILKKNLTLKIYITSFFLYIFETFDETDNLHKDNISIFKDVLETSSKDIFEKSNDKIIMADSLFPEGNLYNHLFGMHPNAQEILRMYINYQDKKYRVGRFRDAYFREGYVVIISRIGASQYEEFYESMVSHPLFVKGTDYDNYLTLYYEKIDSMELKNYELVKYDNRELEVKFSTFDYASYLASGKSINIEEFFKKLAD